MAEGSEAQDPRRNPYQGIPRSLKAIVITAEVSAPSGNKVDVIPVLLLTQAASRLCITHSDERTQRAHSRDSPRDAELF
jgi:hypothetical protein